MTVHKRLTIILLTMLAIIFLPLWGEYLHSGGQIPSDFFDFPSLSVPEKAGFNLIIFIIFATACLFGVVLYVFPSLFGFKKAEIPEPEPVEKANFPAWFWIGLILFLVPLIILWGKFSEPKIIINFAVIPLFWGFTLLLDGIVHKRTGGNSIIQNNPRTIIAIGVSSISGWLIFEYLNFFVSDNWYYPKGDLVGTSAFYIYAIIGSAGLVPMVFEMYSLLTTFKFLKYRYSNGPRVVFSRTLQYIILALSAIATFSVSFFPDELFFIIWLGPLIVFAILLDLIGLWTPFSLIAKEGNWTPLALICLAEFIMGFLCEFWNYFSANHDPFSTFNPDYWMYSIPYVDILPVFEMPLLGLFGYIPFGAYCWIWWLVFTYVLNIPPYIGKNKSYIGY